MEILENNRRTAVDNISHAQKRQKERHDKHLPEQPMEFKIGDQVLLHHTKAEKQWSGKFDPKQCGRKNCLQAGGEKEEGKKREKSYKRRYLVSELEEIKQALVHGTKLPETGEWTPDNAQEWKERLPPAYWFYKIGEQLDLKTPYKDLSQKMFNKEAIQQFEDLQKAILEATIKHYMNEAMITDTYGFTKA
ncbi:hypothetical protein G9A89_020061 [Geosiphon pyriformis]|nr:hypothetical protein G9A89_020061 [Geosiphon pyriformis]